VSEELADYMINGKPLERRCATVVMPVHILRAIYQMQLLRNDGRAEVLVRLSDWQIVDKDDTVHGTGFE
jgi:hypothetical protein